MPTDAPTKEGVESSLDQISNCSDDEPLNQAVKQYDEAQRRAKKEENRRIQQEQQRAKQERIERERLEEQQRQEAKKLAKQIKRQKNKEKKRQAAQKEADGQATQTEDQQRAAEEKKLEKKAAAEAKRLKQEAEVQAKKQAEEARKAAEYQKYRVELVAEQERRQQEVKAAQEAKRQRKAAAEALRLQQEAEAKAKKQAKKAEDAALKRELSAADEEMQAAQLKEAQATEWGPECKQEHEEEPCKEQASAGTGAKCHHCGIPLTPQSVIVISNFKFCEICQVFFKTMPQKLEAITAALVYRFREEHFFGKEIYDGDLFFQFFGNPLAYKIIMEDGKNRLTLTYREMDELQEKPKTVRLRRTDSQPFFKDMRPIVLMFNEDASFVEPVTSKDETAFFRTCLGKFDQ